MEIGVGVKMKSRGTLVNDEKVKFSGARKSVRWKKKAGGPCDIWKLLKNYHFLLFPILSSLSIDKEMYS